MERLKTEPGLGQLVKSSAYWIFGFVLVIWIVELVNLVLGHRLNILGILPRTVAGLPGIVLSPFLHLGIGHVLLNTIPFVILGWLVILHGNRVFLEVSVVIILVSGAGIWLLGRSGYHVGASGLIFGYFGFLVARGWYERSVSSILIAVVTIVLYGGMLWGLLPLRNGVSWEAHLFGLDVGQGFLQVPQVERFDAGQGLGLGQGCLGPFRGNDLHPRPLVFIIRHHTAVVVVGMQDDQALYPLRIHPHVRQLRFHIRDDAGHPAAQYRAGLPAVHEIDAVLRFAQHIDVFTDFSGSIDDHTLSFLQFQQARFCISGPYTFIDSPARLL